VCRNTGTIYWIYSRLRHGNWPCFASLYCASADDRGTAHPCRPHGPICGYDRSTKCSERNGCLGKRPLDIQVARHVASVKNAMGICYAARSRVSQRCHNHPLNRPSHCNGRERTNRRPGSPRSRPWGRIGTFESQFSDFVKQFQ